MMAGGLRMNEERISNLVVLITEIYNEKVERRGGLSLRPDDFGQGIMVVAVLVITDEKIEDDLHLWR